MRYSFFYSIMISILFLNNFYSQKLTENKIDEFTKQSIQKTSWETLFSTTKGTSYFRISKIDNILFVQLKFRLNEGFETKSFSIEKNQELMFKTKEGEIITLKNLKSTVTCVGCGAISFNASQALGIEVSYQMSEEQFNILKNSFLEKIRIYTDIDYKEFEIKKKNALLFTNSLKLIH
ncbi:hypothetical protein J0383_10540 [Flavobacterium endoglycinae]|uniref:DUF4468 domain-containing protein n=1 Tax=Flavobacterium endoglycinae TaxID=2816357 RepID=A0ABX7QJE8_9FLAO|nr:hypothetical protein [Flavobacterium endoglycinae]QSW91219.1 hypothetical protein J0383_10540 [Flavobacterium endoglycinae]